MMVTTIAMVDDKDQDHKNDDNDGCEEGKITQPMM